MTPLRITSIFLLTVVTFAQNNSDPIQPKDWSDISLEEIYSAKTKHHLNNLIFDAIDKISIGGEVGDVGLDVIFKRSVYNHHSIVGNWTVADQIELKGGVPFELLGSQLPSVGSAPLKLTLGVRAGTKILNIRQVHPDDYDSDESKIKDEFFKAKVPNEDFSEEGVWIEKDNSKLKEFIPWKEDIDKVRFANLWNLFKFPIKLPLKSEWLQSMTEGEIMSYQLSGNVDFGPSLGWDFKIPALTDEAEFSLNYKVFLRGEYQVSVQKEEEHFAKVKMRRLGGSGSSYGLGSSDDGVDDLKGVFILDWINQDIVPFNLRIEKSHAKQFEVAYRYDLRHPEAVKAYEAAVLGRFSKSEELAILRSGVQKLPTRYSIILEQQASKKFKFLFLMNHTNSNNKKTWYTDVQMPDGSIVQGIRAKIESSNSFKMITGATEKHVNRFYLNMDNVDNNNLHLVYEQDRSDSSTNAKEMFQYTSQIEKILGDRDIFPEFPIYRPGVFSETVSKKKYVNYGKSRFYYRVRYPKDSLEQWMNLDSGKRWSVLEKAFGVKNGRWSNSLKRWGYTARYGWNTIWNLPLFIFNTYLKKGGDLIVAKRINRRWSRLKRQKTSKKKIEMMARIFSTLNFNYEMISMLNDSAKENAKSYVLSADNMLWGNIWEESATGEGFPPPTIPSDEDLDFDAIPPKHFVDAEATIRGLNWQSPNPEMFKIQFFADIEPQYVYFRLKKDHGGNFLAEQSQYDLVYRVEGQGIEFGLNQLDIDLNDSSNPLRELFSNIKEHKDFRLYMALSRDNQIWGPVAQSRLQ